MDRDRRGLWRPAGHGEAWTARRIGTCAGAVAAAFLLGAAAPTQTGHVAYVVDGDTFRLASGERIRIAGIDAPETQGRQAKCPQELAAGRAATARARALLAGRTVRIERVGRSYDRTVARVRLEGRDVAVMLVEAGAGDGGREADRGLAGVITGAANRISAAWPADSDHRLHIAVSRLMVARCSTSPSTPSTKPRSGA